MPLKKVTCTIKLKKKKGQNRTVLEIAKRPFYDKLFSQATLFGVSNLGELLTSYNQAIRLFLLPCCAIVSAVFLQRRVFDRGSLDFDVQNRCLLFYVVHVVCS